METTKAAASSRLRQEVVQLHDQMREAIEVFLRRQPLVRGTLYQRRRRCGRPGCRCARGQLHVSEAFCQATERGSRHVALATLDLDQVRRGVTDYREVRQARARLQRCWCALQERLQALASLRLVRLEDLSVVEKNTHAC